MDILLERELGKKLKLKLQKKATQMIMNIRNELKIILESVDWMDSESRTKALEKVFEQKNA